MADSKPDARATGLEDVIGGHPDVRIGVSTEGDDGIVLSQLEARSGGRREARASALRAILGWADERGMTVAVTADVHKAARRLFERQGFFPTEQEGRAAIRQPQPIARSAGQPGDRAPEPARTDAPAPSLPSRWVEEPLLAYRVLPDRRPLARIGLDALKWAPTYVGWEIDDLERRATELHGELREAPTLRGDRVAEWMEVHGRAASAEMALNGPGALEPCRALLGEENVKRIGAGAKYLRDSWSDRDRKRAERDMSKRELPSHALQRSASEWFEERSATAAESVAVDRALLVGGVIERTAKAVHEGAEVKAEAPGPRGGARGLERYDDTGEGLTDPELVLVSGYATAFQERIRGLDDQTLAAIHKALPDPFSRFNKAAAAQRASMRDDWRRLTAERTALSEEAGRLAGSAGLDELRESWRRTSVELADHRRANMGQWADGSHPALWVATNGAPAAERIAVEEELRARGYQFDRAPEASQGVAASGPGQEIGGR